MEETKKNEVNNTAETVIDVNHVSKVYKLYNRPADRFKEAMGLSRKKKLYKEHFALNDVDFHVHRGECVGIIGTNGAGKSTILKIITGVLNPTGGDVKVNGRISALLELGAGFNTEYTGIENIYLNGTMIGFTKEEIDAKLDDILSFAEIGDFVYQPVKTYSSGMFVRLAFAVAINIEPEILIVDEALSVGDLFFQVKCYHKFEEFKKMGKTIVFVSHDLSSVNKYCDRVILLNKGQKYAEGGSKEMIDLYKKIMVSEGKEAPAPVKDEGKAPAGPRVKRDGTWKSAMVENPGCSAYGNGVADIVDYCITDHEGEITNIITDRERYSIKMKVQFHKDVEEPIFAVTIRDKQGTEICGTNTMYEDSHVGLVKAGEIREVHFTQQMNLKAGEYMLCLGCTGFKNGGFEVYSRLYEVCSLSVISDKKVTGFFDMDTTVEFD